MNCKPAQSAGAVEYTDCTSVLDMTQKKLMFRFQ